MSSKQNQVELIWLNQYSTAVEYGYGKTPTDFSEAQISTQGFKCQNNKWLINRWTTITYIQVSNIRDTDIMLHISGENVLLSTQMMLGIFCRASHVSVYTNHRATFNESL